MMFTRFILGLAVCLSACAEPNGIAAAQETPSCERLLENEASIPVGLVAQLGPWESCERISYSKSDLGVEEQLLVQWENVKLTIDFQLLETSIYVVEVIGESALTSEWYEAEREKLIPAAFEIDWDNNQFPGPSAEHYLSKVEGTNGQIWVERRADGALEWLRFSYAL